MEYKEDIGCSFNSLLCKYNIFTIKNYGEIVDGYEYMIQIIPNSLQPISRWLKKLNEELKNKTLKKS